MKFKEGDKVFLAESEIHTILLERLKRNNAFGIIVRIFPEFSSPYSVKWVNEKLNQIGLYLHREEDLELYSKPEVGDYVITKKNRIGKIIRITPKSYELQSSDLKTFMIRSHNVIKIEI